MKIFITGGTGFIGKHLIERLGGQPHEILALSRNPPPRSSSDLSKVQFIQGDLSCTESWEDRLKEFCPQTAVHLAWEGIPDYSYSLCLKNLKQGLDIYSLLAEAGCRKIICTGSGWEYGQQKGCLKEEQAISPHNAFASAKRSLYWMGKYLAEEKGIDFAWLRLFYVYGPGQRDGALIPYITRCIKNGRSPEIKTPHAKNDFVYVDDVVDAIAAQLDGERNLPPQNHSVYNIGSGKLTSVQEIINLVYAALSIPLETQTPNLGNEVPHYDGAWADISKIRTELGWEPKINIEEGILQMLKCQP